MGTGGKLSAKTKASKVKYLKTEMKANGPGKDKSEPGRKSWHWAKHARLYSDLFQDL